jgi:hypothetical protein
MEIKKVKLTEEMTMEQFLTELGFTVTKPDYHYKINGVGLVRFSQSYLIKGMSQSKITHRSIEIELPLKDCYQRRRNSKWKKSFAIGKFHTNKEINEVIDVLTKAESEENAIAEMHKDINEIRDKYVNRSEKIQSIQLSKEKDGYLLSLQNGGGWAENSVELVVRFDHNWNIITKEVTAKCNIKKTLVSNLKQEMEDAHNRVMEVSSRFHSALGDVTADLKTFMEKHHRYFPTERCI